MKWIELTVYFEANQPDIAMDLISEQFYDAGVSGVVVQDPREAPSDSWAGDAPPRPEGFAITGYLAENSTLPEKIQNIKNRLTALASKNAITIRFSKNSVDEEDWAQSWKAFFKPERIGKRIVVKPSWCTYEARKADLVIELDPGMAFGTGSHPTTALCIHLLEDHVDRGARVLDIGTGSGILLAAAALLGASTLHGVDNDPLAVEVATKNLIRNGVSPERFEVTEGNLSQGVHRTYDVVVANILSHVIETLLDSVLSVLAPNGVFICSGIVSGNRERIESKMHRIGFEEITVLTRDEWVAVTGRRPRK